MKKAYIVSVLAAALVAFGSCDKDSQIGQSIVQDEVNVIVDSSFTVTGASIAIEKVQSRTVSQLLGRIDAPGYGKLESSIVTQFMPSSSLANSSVKAADIDSIMLYMYMASGEYVGDSISPMGLEVYRLTENLPSPIYSDFDPTGYYNPDEVLASTIYNVANVSRDTTIAGGVEIAVELPKWLGRELYQAYLDNKSNFSTPTSFVNNVFKGIYIKNSFGSGRLIRSTSTMMSLFYHYYEEDSLIHGTGNYFAVTPEIITNNDLTFDISPEIESRVAAGQQIVMGPAGLEVSVTFPVPDLIAAYNKQTSNLKVLNSLSFSVPGEAIDNKFSFGVPSYLLMVLSKEKDKFFANNQLPDNVTSFYATYDAVSGTYDFGQMRKYLSDLLKKDTIDESDYTFTIVPVSAVFETNNNSSYYYGSSTSQTLTMMTPYMASPVMCRLLLDSAKIKLTFSTQSIFE